MNTITPFLWFDEGKMDQAIDLYLSVFRDARIVMRNPMTAELELLGQRFMLLNAKTRHSFNESISFFIRCKDQSEVDYYWNALVQNGGEESMCGWLRDPFGVSWQVIPEALGRLLSDPDRARSGRVMQAMLQMRKIIVADLEAAAAG